MGRAFALVLFISAKTPTILLGENIVTVNVDTPGAHEMHLLRRHIVTDLCLVLIDANGRKWQTFCPGFGCSNESKTKHEEMTFHTQESQKLILLR